MCSIHPFFLIVKNRGGVLILLNWATNKNKGLNLGLGCYKKLEHLKGLSRELDCAFDDIIDRSRPE